MLDQKRNETFQFLMGLWDIDKAWELIGAREPNSSVIVEQTKGYFGLITVDREFAMTVDLSRPLVMILLKTEGAEGCFVIDGWHRLFRAVQENVGELPAHLLSEDEEQLIQLR